ncbi:Fe-S oxidoreductase [Microbacterium sp. VKM Ac-2923]|uniref:Fe-S oxidoreductase n=1 Tax=Microbacterium sp. VKM Ac-2923 TaxID=2929476 RepID=UPI001FB1D654|nr:Fe-S oxidoreductase [Microbacterium sp. VKM Ac-2923]MCJ1709309.1 Fe-S oxidoreductase [Microbacterium sp. VKM Ac-2923]
MSPIRRPPAGWRERADRAVARGRRFDRFIPAALLDSPVSRVGYWYGCTVGWVWGSLWSTGRIEKRQGLWVFRGLPAWAFPRGGVCVGGCFLTGDDRPTDTVLGHEAVHRRQWRRYGFLMPALYALAGRDPLRNRFEIEAGLVEGNYVPRGS